MTTAPRPLVSVILGLTILRCSAPVMATPNQSASDHVRAINPTIATLIQRASERSHTFRGLLDTINASDGIVYIEPGKCGQSMRGCFENVTMAGTTRLLWVKVDPRGNECDLIALLGHELQHTIEVLGDPHVTSFSQMYFFYSRVTNNFQPAFETLAAERIQETVRAEVRANSRCSTIY